MRPMRGAMLYAVDCEQEVALARAWFGRWIKQVTAMRSDGCGCCVKIFVFEAPAAAIAAIPSSIRTLVTAAELAAPLSGQVASPYKTTAKERRSKKNAKRR